MRMNALLHQNCTFVPGISLVKVVSFIGAGDRGGCSPASLPRRSPPSPAPSLRSPRSSTLLLHLLLLEGHLLLHGGAQRGNLVVERLDGVLELLDEHVLPLVLPLHRRQHLEHLVTVGSTIAGRRALAGLLR